MRRITLILLLSTLTAKSQTSIEYEQLAFNYYLSNIAEAESKGTVWLNIVDHSNDFVIWHPGKCLDFESLDMDSTLTNISGLKQITLPPNKTNYKIKPEDKGRYPRVYASVSYSTDGSKHIVSITEIHKMHGNIYHIEMDMNGTVLNWCHSGFVF